MSSNATIIVGAVIEKSGKYLLVQEAKSSCRGKWNLPAGHLDPNETILEGAKREVKEETGCDIELTGICQIGNRISENDLFVSIIFTARLLQEKITFDQTEILDVRWFSFEEITTMADQIRSQPLLFGAIKNAKAGHITPLEIIQQY